MSMILCMNDVERCPTCGKPFKSNKPQRICWECKQPIVKGHKFYFDSDSHVRHRNCKEPDSYT
jgi:predicted amidophosphoribosyltransferase